MHKIAKKLPVAATAATTIMAFVHTVVLADNNTGESFVPNSISSIDNIVTVIRNIIRFIILIAFVLAFLFLIIGGIRWITAGGDEKGVERARGMITAALIGLVIILVSYALIVLVQTFFGVNIISGNIVIPTATSN